MQKILQARKIPRNKLLEKERYHTEENKLTFSIKYYPTFQNATILEELQNLLAPDKEQKVFPKVTIVGLRNGKSLRPFSKGLTSYS